MDTLTLIFGLIAFVSAITTVVCVSRLENRITDHAKCIAHVAQFTGDHFAAQVLRAAAEDYSSVSNQRVIQRMVQEGHKRGPDVSLPSAWLMDRADALDPTVEP